MVTARGEVSTANLVGRVLAGKVEIQRFIAGGGMGWVFQARHRRLDRKVAVKVLKSGGDDGLRVLRFEAEAKAASRLEHPHSVQIHDFGEDGPDRLLYLVMEYLDGVDLGHILERGPLPVQRASNIMAQALAALAAAHDGGLIHRDVKPSNLIVLNRRNDDGEAADFVKVVDFGLARFMNGPEELAGEGGPRLVGTPCYMAPEQAVGDALDGRADVYAAGCMFFELLTGNPPFDAQDCIGLLMKHVSEPPPPILDILPDLDPRIAGLVHAALAKTPDERPTAREFRKTLLEIFGHSDRFISSAGRALPVPSHMTTSQVDVWADDLAAPLLPDSALLPVSSTHSDLVAEIPLGTADLVPAAEPDPEPDILDSPSDVLTGYKAGKFPTPSLGGFETETYKALSAPDGSGAKVPSSSPTTHHPSAPKTPDGELDFDAIVGEAVASIRDLKDSPESTTDGQGIHADHTRHAVQLAERAVYMWRNYGIADEPFTGTEPFYVRDHNGSFLGPLKSTDALTVIQRECAARHFAQVAISPDRERWMPAADFLRLTGQEALLDDQGNIPAQMPRVPFAGQLLGRSLVAVLGRVAREKPTGRLIFQRKDADERWETAEIHLICGQPTFVYSSEPSLQVPNLLVAKEIVTDALLPRLLYDVLREERPLEEILGRAAGVKFQEHRTLFMKERLYRILGWGRSGRFYLDAHRLPASMKPFARSALSILPEMIYRAYAPELLHEVLMPLLSQPLVRSERLRAGVAELFLTESQLQIVRTLVRAPTLEQGLAMLKGNERQAYALAYILVDAGLLLRPL